MKNLEEMGAPGLGFRLKRVSDVMFRQSDELYKSRGIALQSRSFPLLQLLAAHGTLPVTELADYLGLTHPAISQMSKKLEAQGWLYHEMDVVDERRRLLALTPKGYELVDQLKPLWQKLEKVLERILQVAGYGLFDNITILERELGKSSLQERIELIEREERSEQVEIIHFEPGYSNDFYRLNRHWLDKHFYVEAIDHDVLSQPQQSIIEPGGFILLARLKGEIIGTAALIVGNGDKLELSKMSVDENNQGLGVGEKLARAAIAQYQASEFSMLFLESNRKLLPALNLYLKLGFEEKEYPFEDSHYSRADIYMEYVGQPS